MRAAQSKGIVDLLALFPAHCPEVWLVQAKYSVHGGGTISPAEREELIALALETGAFPILARPGKNGRGIEFINLNSQEQIG